MRVDAIPEIGSLSTAEKILLVQDLWDSIAADAAPLPVPRSHLDELERRWERSASSPGDRRRKQMSHRLASFLRSQQMRSWWWGCSTALADRLPLRPPWKIAPDAHPTRGRPSPTSWTPCSRPSGATSSSAPTSSSPTICTPCAARATRPSGAASWCAARRASAPTARSCPGSRQGRGPGRRRDGLNAPTPGRPTPNLRRGFEVKSYRE